MKWKYLVGIWYLLKIVRHSSVELPKLSRCGINYIIPSICIQYITYYIHTDIAGIIIANYLIYETKQEMEKSNLNQTVIYIHHVTTENTCTITNLIQKIGS